MTIAPDDWHLAPLTLVHETLATSDAGLNADEAADRLARHGPNALPARRPPSVAAVFASQFRSPLVFILGVAAALAVATGERTDALFILGVLTVNALIGTWQEYGAERSSLALQRLMKIRASVLRDGETIEIDAEALVPGDVVLLESGNRVPADLRLTSARGLEIDESLLTGESLPVLKDPLAPGVVGAALGDRRNTAFAGTLVAHGRSRGVVVATGLDTAIGRIASDVADAGVDQGRPPLIDRMERFSRRIGAAVVLAAAAVGAIGVLLHGFGLQETLMFAIALAVSAIPEGLPVSLTVTLSAAARRMAKRGVIVRRLAAVEGLGSCTLIASDKTGTLTCNELTVVEARTPDGGVFTFTGAGFEPLGEVLHDGRPIDRLPYPALGELCRAMVLCNEAELHALGDGWVRHGDPTDVALLAAAHKHGWRRDPLRQAHPELAAIPFEAERRYSATFHAIDGTTVSQVKGAPERVAEMLADASARRWLLEQAQAMARDGQRVLAFAAGETRADVGPDDVAPEPAALTPLGLVGMVDPPRPGVRDAIGTARAAGIRTIMVTGDHPATALAIARDLDIVPDTARADDAVINGTELDDDADLAGVVARANVFSRVSPHQKLQIVRAARAAGDYVAVTGDGVNDAPALKAANIGVAMGRGGTDVARESAELIITDDHFATITAGIEEGRIAYDNVRKVIYLLVSTGAAEIVLVALAVASGSPLPLLPAQLLWLNLVTNGLQDVALALEPGEPGVLQRPPRPTREPIFDRLMVTRTLLAALVMGPVGFAVFSWLLAHGWSVDGARNVVLLLMVLFENFHILNCRSETRSAFALPLRRSPFLIAGALGAFALHVAMMHTDLGATLLGTEPVSGATWLALVAVASSVLAVMEAHKGWRARRARRGRSGDAPS